MAALLCGGAVLSFVLLSQSGLSGLMLASDGEAPNTHSAWIRGHSHHGMIGGLWAQSAPCLAETHWTAYCAGRFCIAVGQKPTAGQWLWGIRRVWCGRGEGCSVLYCFSSEWPCPRSDLLQLRGRTYL